MYIVGEGGTRHTKPMPLVLCKKELPWVETCENLGHTLSTDGTMRQDIKEKRAQFINSAVNIRETFSYAFPEQIVKVVDKYACSFYSSIQICGISIAQKQSQYLLHGIDQGLLEDIWSKMFWHVDRIT